MGYLQAKCLEKKAKIKWSEYKLYLHAAYPLMDHTSVCHTHKVTAKLWTQLTVTRFLLKAALFVPAWIALIFYLILQLNLLYEYLVLSLIVWSSSHVLTSGNSFSTCSCHVKSFKIMIFCVNERERKADS